MRFTQLYLTLVTPHLLDNLGSACMQSTQVDLTLIITHLLDNIEPVLVSSTQRDHTLIIPHLSHENPESARMKPDQQYITPTIPNLLDIIEPVLVPSTQRSIFNIITGTPLLENTEPAWVLSGRKRRPLLHIIIKFLIPQMRRIYMCKRGTLLSTSNLRCTYLNPRTTHTATSD